VLIATPPDEHTPPAADGAVRPMVVREATVDVAYHRSGAYPDIAPDEREWAVLRGGDVTLGRVVHGGDLVLVTNLESLRPGDLVDVRVEGDGDADGARAASRERGEAGTEASP